MLLVVLMHAQRLLLLASRNHLAEGCDNIVALARYSDRRGVRILASYSGQRLLKNVVRDCGWGRLSCELRFGYLGARIDSPHVARSRIDRVVDTSRGIAWVSVCTGLERP